MPTALRAIDARRPRKSTYAQVAVDVEEQRGAPARARSRLD